jgi:hypothetical protein
MTITISYGQTLTAYKWTEMTPWVADPDVTYVRTYSGGTMHYNGKALPTSTAKGFAPRNTANVAALSTIAGQEVTVASDNGMSGTARVISVSADASTAAYVFVTLTLRRTAA